MDTKRLSFEVDGDQIDFKSYAKKDFLELSIKAISDVNPNRNQSWFTTESLNRAVESGTCKNKPVLGYFENDDFVSHNGNWKKDQDTGVSYWDTLGSKGERILGVIREQDDVETVQDAKGRTWLCFNAVLWVQYSYKQVKRLLKDAKKAKQNGGPTKNVSVEVDITSWEELDNGVMKINEFNLVGVTILGSRNGIKVEPGIEDADLSVVDMMGRDVYDKQMQGLRLAYEKLDDPAQTQGEVISNMENNTITNEETTGNNSVETPENVAQQNFEAEQQTENPECGNGACPEHEEGCGEPAPEQQEPVEHNENGGDCGCGDNHEGDHDGDHEEPQHEEENADEQTPTEHDEAEKGCEAHDDPENDEEDHEDESCHQEAGCQGEESNPEEHPVHDLAWLLQEDCTNIDRYEEVITYYSDKDVSQKDYLTKVVELIKNYEAVKDNCAKLETEKAELSEKVACFEYKEFLNNASVLIRSAANLSEEDGKKFFEKCQNKEINDLDTLKTQIAVAVFEATKNTVEPETNASFNADVYTPTVGNTQKPAEKLDRWGRMRKNVNK